MPLGQIGNTHPSLYAFLCEFDALKESFLPLIFLHDFSPYFGKCVSTRWSPDRELVLSSFLRRPDSLPGMRIFNDVGVRRCSFLCLAGNYIERRTCRNILDGLRRGFLSDQWSNIPNSTWQPCPRKWL